MGRESPLTAVRELRKKVPGVGGGGGVLDPMEWPVPHYPDIPPSHTRPRDDSILTSTHENMEILTHSKHMWIMSGTCFPNQSRIIHKQTHNALLHPQLCSRGKIKSMTHSCFCLLGFSNTSTLRTWKQSKFGQRNIDFMQFCVVAPSLRATSSIVRQVRISG